VKPGGEPEDRVGRRNTSHFVRKKKTSTQDHTKSVARRVLEGQKEAIKEKGPSFREEAPPEARGGRQEKKRK